MRTTLERVLFEMNRAEREASRSDVSVRTDVRARLVVTAFFLVCMLSVPLGRLSVLLLFFAFPVLESAWSGIRYRDIFRRSLAVLPFVVFIGAFNLFYDRRPAFAVGSVVFTQGAVSFVSIAVRGLLSVQAVAILFRTEGYYRLCRGMQKLGMPWILTTQLLMVYRYIYVLVEQSLDMCRARDARSFGRRSYPLKIWAAMIGQLLVRTVERSQAIHRAMLARGFDGRIPDTLSGVWRWGRRDTAYVVLWCVPMLAVRAVGPAVIFSTFIPVLP